MRTKRTQAAARDESGTLVTVWRIGHFRDAGGLDGPAWVEVQCEYAAEDGESLNKRGDTLEGVHTKRRFTLA